MKQKINFHCKSLKPLSEYYEEFLKLIEETIEENIPIIIRHDNDVDGYTSGLAIENALKKKYPEHEIMRRVSKTPYANLEDANNDSGRKALIIILDNGSSEDNLDALKRLKAFDMKVGIIDHHPIHKECIAYSDVHINPRRKGITHHITSGMLSFELARMISGFDNLTLPAIAGYDDRSITKEWLEYKRVSEKELKDIDNALNYEIKKARGGNNASLWAILDRNNKRHELILKANLESYEKIKKEMMPKLKNRIKRENNIFFIDIEGIAKDMPNPGMIMQWALEIIYPESREYYIRNGQPKYFVYGMLNKQIMLRNTADKSFTELIRELKREYGISGGGHQDRASIRFQANKEKIIKKIRDWSLRK